MYFFQKSSIKNRSPVKESLTAQFFHVLFSKIINKIRKSCQREFDSKFSRTFQKNHDKKNEKWSVNKLNAIINNNNQSEFQTQRPSESNLKIPEVAKSHYQSRTFVMYNLSDQVEY
jgi:hypothetical protein